MSVTERTTERTVVPTTLHLNASDHEGQLEMHAERPTPGRLVLQLSSTRHGGGVRASIAALLDADDIARLHALTAPMETR
jgi:hypothetical protein